MKPLFKKSHVTIVKNGEKLNMFLEADYLEIDDPERTFSTLLEEMDGTRTVEEISTKLCMPKEEITELIHELNSFGLIEDQSHISTTTLSTEEIERYKSHFNFFSTFSDIYKSKFSYQEKLKSSKVAILGLGGSSIILSNLAGMGVGSIIGIDFDRIELSNLNRQLLYTENNIGELKTRVSKEQILKRNSTVNFEGIDLKVTSPFDLLDLLSDTHIIINTIDQPSIQSTRWVNFSSVHNKIPLIQGGSGLNKLLIQTFFPDIGACFDCYLIQILRENPEFKEELKEMYGSVLEGRNTAFAPNIAFLAGLITSQLSNIICEFTISHKSSYTTEYSSIPLEQVAHRVWDKIDDCPTCGCNSNSKSFIEIDELISIALQKVGN